MPNRNDCCVSATISPDLTVDDANNDLETAFTIQHGGFEDSAVVPSTSCRPAGPEPPTTEAYTSLGCSTMGSAQNPAVLTVIIRKTQSVMHSKPVAQDLAFHHRELHITLPQRSFSKLSYCRCLAYLLLSVQLASISSG
jgi:hypothetical protein